MKRHVFSYPKDGSHKQWIRPRLVILLSTGDLSQVAGSVAKDLYHPIGRDVIACVLVEEPKRDEFIKKLQHSLQLMDERLHTHPNYLRSVETIKRLNCSTIHIEDIAEAGTKKQCHNITPGSPIVVLDFPQYYFGDYPPGIITLNSFRNISDAVKLCKRESLKFDTASVWSSKLAECFELVSRLDMPSHFAFNCMNAPFVSLAQYTHTNGMVLIVQNIRYEILAVNGKIKIVAFLIK
ncbi:uncharacterized protein [Drosophila tropicalis]|uniref:uncharacterized protein n=1 Tax=Drosophila tropicalis TaxID=46794 RepID=UPI0035ABEE05